MEDKRKEVDSIISQLQELMTKLTDLNNNKTPGTNEPAFFGNGLADVREFDGMVQIGLHTQLGWFLARLPPSAALSVNAEIARCVAQIVARNGYVSKLSESGNNFLH